MLNQQQTQDTLYVPASTSYGAGHLDAPQAVFAEGELATTSDASKAGDTLSTLDDLERELVDVARLRRKLPRRSFLRRAAIDWNSLQHNDSQTLHPLTDAKLAVVLNKLRDPNPAAWRERTLCAWLLGHFALNGEQTAQAAQVLANVVQKRHVPRGRRVRANMRHIVEKSLPFAAVYALLIVAHTLVFSVPPSYTAFFQNHTISVWEMVLFAASGFVVTCAALTGILTGLMFPFLTALNAQRGNQARAMAALALGRMRAVEGVEELACAALDRNAQVRRASEHALQMCLPSLTLSHYGQVRTDTTSLLCNLLNHKKERLFANHPSTERLVLAVLDALGKVGSGDAAPHVARVAQDGWTDAVRERACAILPLLEARQRQAGDPHQLLRASALPPDTGSQLMRPTENNTTDTPEQLLRASTRG